MSWKKSFSLLPMGILFNFMRSNRVSQCCGEEIVCVSSGRQGSVNYYYFRRNLIDKSDCDVFEFDARFYHPFLFDFNSILFCYYFIFAKGNKMALNEDDDDLVL